MASPDSLIAIFGPTGVGKTAVAIEIAERLRERGEDPMAISADALQVYRGLEILTGAATAEEQERLEHRLLSFVPITETFSAGQFAALAHAEIDAALAAGRRPIVVGGTGLYLQAALTDLELRPPPPPGVRERILAEARRSAGPRRSTRSSPSARPARPPASTRPTARGSCGRWSCSRWGRSRLRSARRRGSGPPTCAGRRFSAGLTMERERLYERIDARVDAMIAAGVEDEVRRADAAGASPTARKALGFEELLRGDWRR